jgi:hypothetical protein
MERGNFIYIRDTSVAFIGLKFFVRGSQTLRLVVKQRQLIRCNIFICRSGEVAWTGLPVY